MTGPMKMSETGVAVWSYRRQKFIEFVPCPGENRVRIDVHDGLTTYGVFPVRYTDDTHFDLLSQQELGDWMVDYT